MTDQGHGKDLKFTKTIDPTIPLEYSSPPIWTAANQIVPFLPQSNIYYVGNAGNASFNGKNDNICFDSYASAISAVKGQGPSPTNRFGIVFIGGFIAIGNFIHPSYTTTYALDGGEIVGTLAMDGADSMAIMDKYTGPSSGTYGIHRGISATGNAFVEVHGEANIGDYRAISNAATGNFYLAINNLVASPSSQPWYSVIENLGIGDLFVKVNNLDASGGTANVVRAGAYRTFCDFGKVKSTTGSGAFIYAQASDTGRLYIKVQEVDASAGNLANLISGYDGPAYLEAQKASGAIIGDASKLIASIKEGPVAGKRVTYSDGNLNASDNIAAGGNISTSSGNISTSYGTVSGQSGLIRNVTGEATLSVWGGSNPLAWSSLHLYSDSTFFRGAGVRISKNGGAGQWWAGVQYSAGGQYRIVYSTGTNPETGGISAINCLVNGEVRLPNIGSIASTSGYHALYAHATTGLGLVKRFTSSIKYKENVQDMGDTSWLYQLRPVTFTSKVEGDDKTPQYGLISEEAALVNDKIGRDETVHYEQLISVLINEVKKLNDRITALETA